MPNWIEKLAKIQTRVTLFGSAQKGGALLAYVSPLIGGLSAWGPVQTAKLDGWALWLGVGGALVGSALNQGAGWVLARGRETMDRQHSNRITAALRAVRGARGRHAELRSVREQLLRCIADTARSTAASPDAEVLACLLEPVDQALVVTAYSAFRNNSLPSGAIPLDEPEGAARAFRERKPTAIANVHEGPHRSRFDGKRYKSLLAFPLLADGECVGVVAVDSTLAGHFRPDADEVAVHLLPLVEVLLETLTGEPAVEAAHVAR